MRLNLGAGGSPLPGYHNIDIHGGIDVRDPAGYASVPYQEIRVSHVLEHLSFAEAYEALERWVSLLAPGGELRIAVPDVAVIVRMMQDHRAEPWQFYLMGGQTDEFDFHKSCWTETLLAQAMLVAGLDEVTRWEPRPDEQDTCRHPVSLRLHGLRPQEQGNE